MFLEGALRIDDNVVKISVAEETKIGIEDRVDEPLEDGWGCCEAHGHDGVFERAKEGFEGGRSLRTRCHTEIGEA
jgi:hypothetical protein